MSNFLTKSGITPRASAAPSSPLYPPGDPRASGLASISRSLEIGRLLYQLRRRNPGLAGSEPRGIAPFPLTTQPAVRAPFPLPDLSLLAIQPEVRIPFPLPARPAQLGGIRSSPQPTSPIPQIISSSTSTQFSQPTPPLSLETQRMLSGNATPATASWVVTSVPNFLSTGAAPARGYDAGTVLGPRGSQGVRKRIRRKKRRRKSQKNDDDRPLDENNGQGASKQQKGSKQDQDPTQTVEKLVDVPERLQNSGKANVLIRGLAIRTIDSILVNKTFGHMEEQQLEMSKGIGFSRYVTMAANPAVDLVGANGAALETEALTVTSAIPTKLLIGLNKHIECGSQDAGAPTHEDDRRRFVPPLLVIPAQP
ncbi:hypothetical protein HOY82DRAFT_597051 [Tuber indicum]|nr:hypothetical protein HOY82DRAFT_597051 [Tuber indicum]